jgi:hypothetical protein
MECHLSFAFVHDFLTSKRCHISGTTDWKLWQVFITPNPEYIMRNRIFFCFTKKVTRYQISSKQNFSEIKKIKH